MTSLLGRGCAEPTLGSAGPHKHKQAKVGTLGSPKSKQDTDLALQRGCATRQAGDVEVEGSLPLSLPQQSTEGVLGEAEPWWAAGGQLQAGSEWQSLCGGHHARPGILREELQGTAGRDTGGAQRIALGTLPACGPRGEAHTRFVST